MSRAQNDTRSGITLLDRIVAHDERVVTDPVLVLVAR